MLVVTKILMDFIFYPLESHDFQCWEDGTVGFHDPLIYEEV